MNAIGVPVSDAERLTLGEYSALLTHYNKRNTPEKDVPTITEDDWDTWERAPEVIH